MSHMARFPLLELRYIMTLKSGLKVSSLIREMESVLALIKCSIIKELVQVL